jgi:hypothetical protein
MTSASARLARRAGIEINPPWRRAMALKLYGLQTLCAAERRTIRSGHAQQRIAVTEARLDADLLPFDRHMDFNQIMTSINTLEDR